MHTVTAATAVFAALLAVAGAGKATRPGGTEQALQGARLPSHAWLVRLLGIAEVTLGLAVLGAGGAVPAGLLALAYGAFAVFAELRRRRGASCGCFGEATPATRLHVAVDATAAAVATAAAIIAPPPLLSAVAGDAVTAGVAVGMVAVSACLLRALLAEVPDLAAAMALHTGRGDA